MSNKIKNPNDKNIKIGHKTDFLQSHQWGHFQESIGQKVIRLQVDGALVQMIKYSLPFSQSYLYCPHMRIKKQELRSKNKEWRIGNGECLIGILKQMQATVKKEGTIFLRIDPLVIADSPEAGKWQSAFETSGFRKAPKGYYFSAISQSPYTAVLDISRPEKEILKNIRYNTRRSIRLARERGAAIRQSNDIQAFYNLLQQTSQRKGIHPHPKEHYFKLKQAFGDDLVLLLAQKDSSHCEGGGVQRRVTKQSHFDTSQHAAGLPRDPCCARVARNDSNILAGAMVLFFNNQATYLHAGSLSGRQNCEAPYLILWQAICQAKKRGCTELDLGAVAPEGAAKHPWQSITTFKMGWRPERIEYLGAYDWVNKKLWYWLYCLKKNL